MPEFAAVVVFLPAGPGGDAVEAVGFGRIILLGSAAVHERLDVK